MSMVNCSSHHPPLKTDYTYISKSTKTYFVFEFNENLHWKAIMDLGVMREILFRYPV